MLIFGAGYKCCVLCHDFIWGIALHLKRIWMCFTNAHGGGRSVLSLLFLLVNNPESSA